MGISLPAWKGSNSNSSRILNSPFSLQAKTKLFGSLESYTAGNSRERANNVKLIDIIRKVRQGNYELCEKMTSDEGITLEVAEDHHLFWYVLDQVIDAGKVLVLPGT